MDEDIYFPDFCPSLSLSDEELALQLQAQELASESLEDGFLCEVIQANEYETTASAGDSQSDLELAKILQNEEDSSSSDYLLAKHLQEELEQGEKKNLCGRCSCHHDGNNRVGDRRMDFDSMEEHDGETATNLCTQCGGHHGNSHHRGNVRRRRRLVALPRFTRRTNPVQIQQRDPFDDFEELLAIADAIGEAREQGLLEEEINTLPTSRYTARPSSISTSTRQENSEDSQCHICLSQFEVNDTLRTLPCCHRFHRDCIDQWIQRKALCPVCRIEIKEQL